MQRGVQGYPAHKKQSPPRTLQEAYACGPVLVLGGGTFFCERGTPVGHTRPFGGYSISLGGLIKCAMP